MWLKIQPVCLSLPVALRQVPLLRVGAMGGRALSPAPAGSSGSEIIQPVLAKAAASHQPGAPVVHCCASSISPFFCVFSMSFPQSFQINSIPTPEGNAEKWHV